MSERIYTPQHSELVERPRYAAPIVEDLLIGGQRLRQAFIETPMRVAGRDAPLIADRDIDAAAVVLIRNGFAYRSCALADGRRAILDIVLPGDIAGLDQIVLARRSGELTAAGRAGYHVLGAAALRQLMTDRSIWLHAMAIIAEARWRADRLAASIGRLDAQARLCVMLLDIHDRLRRRGLINRPTYNLPLTQEQIADHLGLTLVHVNRTLRKLREERTVLVDRQVVIIMDVDRLRQYALGLPQAAEMPDFGVLSEPGSAE